MSPTMVISPNNKKEYVQTHLTIDKINQTNVLLFQDRKLWLQNFYVIYYSYLVLI